MVLAARLFGVAAATTVMATTCLVGRSTLSALDVAMAGRAALTIALGLVVYTLALWWFAPDIVRRVLGLGRRIVSKVGASRRREVLQSS